jgi:hypothetical protein
MRAVDASGREAGRRTANLRKNRQNAGCVPPADML